MKNVHISSKTPKREVVPANNIKYLVIYAFRILFRLHKSAKYQHSDY